MNNFSGAPLRLVLVAGARPNFMKIAPIIKDPRGDSSSVDNIRPITFSDTMTTIFETYFLKKLNATIDLSPE